MRTKVLSFLLAFVVLVGVSTAVIIVVPFGFKPVVTEADETDMFSWLEANYQNFTITLYDKSGKQLSNAVVKGSSKEGDLDVKCYGPRNGMGFELSIEYAVPKLKKDESYTIIPSESETSVVTGNPLSEYSTRLHSGGNDGFFASVWSTASGEIMFSYGGAVATDYGNQSVLQKISVTANNSTTPWYTVKVEGTDTGFKAFMDKKTTVISSVNNVSINVSANNTYDSIAFNNIPVTGDGIKVIETGGAGVIKNNKNAVISGPSPVMKFKINFYGMGGSPLKTTEYVTYNSKIVVPKGITREGYAIEGWYTDTEYAKKWNFNNTVKDDVSLYAKWKELSN